MSSFTAPVVIMAKPSIPKGWRRFLPPSFMRPRWLVYWRFDYAVGDLDHPSETISVPNGFTFDGASVPLLFRSLVPMAHPNYIQAAALHDWMLDSGRYSRRYCDHVFHEALGVLGMPGFWRGVMFAAVRLGSLRYHLRNLMMRGAKWKSD